MFQSMKADSSYTVPCTGKIAPLYFGS